ncbi:MAG: hypothetical protein ABSE84_31985, partial [Isosphaeraceae bacterium]
MGRTEKSDCQCRDQAQDIKAGEDNQKNEHHSQPDEAGPGEPSADARNSAAYRRVYTSEYGWIWMPYGNQYTYEGTANDAYPYSYVYYPSYGW